MGYFGEQECISYNIHFANTAHYWINDKFGQWLEAPLCLGELLQPGQARKVARKILKKSTALPKYVPEQVWAIICSIADPVSGGGDDLMQYEITMQDRTVNFKTYLEGVFLAICIHNVDPERAFSIIHAYVKRCPNAGIPAIGARLNDAINPPLCSPEIFEAKKKEAQGMGLAQPVNKLHNTDTKGDTGNVMKSHKSLKEKHGSKMVVSNAEHDDILRNSKKLLHRKEKRKAEPSELEFSDAESEVDAIEVNAAEEEPLYAIMDGNAEEEREEEEQDVPLAEEDRVMADHLKQSESETVASNKCDKCKSTCVATQVGYDEQAEKPRWLCRACSDMELTDFGDVGEADIPEEQDDTLHADTSAAPSTTAAARRRESCTCMSREELLAHTKAQHGIEIGSFVHTFSRTGNKKKQTYEAYFEVGRVKDVVMDGDDILCQMEHWMNTMDVDEDDMEHTFSPSGSEKWFQESVKALGLVPFLHPIADAWKKDDNGTNIDHNTLSTHMRSVVQCRAVSCSAGASRRRCV